MGDSYGGGRLRPSNRDMVQALEGHPTFRNDQMRVQGPAGDGAPMPTVHASPTPASSAGLEGPAPTGGQPSASQKEMLDTLATRQITRTDTLRVQSPRGDGAAMPTMKAPEHRANIGGTEGPVRATRLPIYGGPH
jgi:hypothetical protein